ncbi:MAG: hypothetical protein RIE08_10080 [Acidimicrobiales bacterium]
MRLQPGISTRPYEELLAETTDPLHRRILELTILHFRYEGLCQIDDLMATVAPNPRYVLHGGPWGYLVLEGREAVAEMYDGLTTAASIIESETRHIALADWGISFHTLVKHQIPGRHLLEWGPQDYDHSHLGGIDDDAHYLVQIDSSALFTYDSFDGEVLLTGEIVWWHNPPGSVTLMDPADVLSAQDARSDWMAHLSA